MKKSSQKLKYSNQKCDQIIIFCEKSLTVQIFKLGKFFFQKLKYIINVQVELYKVKAILILQVYSFNLKIASKK